MTANQLSVTELVRSLCTPICTTLINRVGWRYSNASDNRLKPSLGKSLGNQSNLSRWKKAGHEMCGI
ncbi:hypothetical protein J5X98_04140 [Leptothermofonsia sichuanensis E412]|uniref:hypothetical protein n=1 Tax=Leptothermofonsia sichuanensis TaxID=2917832 RepID=UPI001CA6C674|nr:hypothetical protein [Leptothermofonsia sichuanensis]QZZ21656.1 hypothetical protein J5X98_04140 [Leptothermofonsia sichuanensis E412]